MKKLSIYEVYVLMQDQAQCDRMKQLCIDNGLPVWSSLAGWAYYKEGAWLCFDEEDREFYCFVDLIDCEKKTQITEQEFIELLKNKEK